jgi:glyoxylase-like metal-dependent hydrolase (beta-lactamase superfamily II)
VATLKGVFTMPRLSVVKTIEDGQVLDIPGKPIVLHTPGHTEGEIVLLLENDRSLISGDTLVTRNLLTGELGQPQLTSPILNADFRKAKRSLDLIRELGELTMLPGHGRPWFGNMADAVEQALQNEKKS